MDNYLYFAVDSSEGYKIKYIGKGKKDRYKHITSGRSSNVKANNHYFTSGMDSIKVFKWVLEFNDDYSEELEKQFIAYFNPCWNSRKPSQAYGSLDGQLLGQAQGIEVILKVFCFGVIPEELEPTYFEIAAILGGLGDDIPEELEESKEVLSRTIKALL